MPNHVTNRVTITGPAESIEDFRKGCFSVTKKDENETYEKFDFNKIIPSPGFISLDDFTFGSREDKTGRNWYNWSIESWGTKWNSYSLEFIKDEPGLLSYRFDTAWSTPWAILETIARWFSELSITIEYFDEGGGFWGVDIKREGSHSFERKTFGPNDKSDEAIKCRDKLGLELKGYSFNKFEATKPALCCDIDLSKVRYPVWGFPKIDGVRIINLTGTATARSLMTHSNKYTTERLSNPKYFGLDGEGAVGDIRSEALCRNTTSALNTIAGEPCVDWHVFDYLHPDVVGLTYQNRFKVLREHVKLLNDKSVRIVEPTLIKNEAHLLAFYRKCLKEGFEGAIYRDPMGMHKDGRCTAIEANYMRMKPSSDKEALVLEVTEAQKNNNEKKTNALGHSERSSHKENKVGKGMIGTLICLDLETKQNINIGPGKMKHSDRIYYFENPSEIQGQYIKYRSMDKGIKDAPRFGRFISFRSEEDTKTLE